jgi:hypothetical protein
MCTRLHGVTSQKTAIFILAARNSDITNDNIDITHNFLCLYVLGRPGLLQSCRANDDDDDDDDDDDLYVLWRYVHLYIYSLYIYMYLICKIWNLDVCVGLCMFACSSRRVKPAPKLITVKTMFLGLGLIFIQWHSTIRIEWLIFRARKIDNEYKYLSNFPAVTP